MCPDAFVASVRGVYDWEAGRGWIVAAILDWVLDGWSDDCCLNALALIVDEDLDLGGGTGGEDILSGAGMDG